MAAKTPAQFEDLTKQQLVDLFMSVNSRYLSISLRAANINGNRSEFIKIRNDLREVLNELQRRRQEKE